MGSGGGTSWALGPVLEYGEIKQWITHAAWSSWTYAWVIKTKVHSLQKQIQSRMAESDYCNKYSKQTVMSTQKKIDC